MSDDLAPFPHDETWEGWVAQFCPKCSGGVIPVEYQAAWKLNDYLPTPATTEDGEVVHPERIVWKCEYCRWVMFTEPRDAPKAAA